MKPLRAINMNAPDKEFLDEFHKILAKSIVKRLGEEDSRKLVELVIEEDKISVNT